MKAKKRVLVLRSEGQLASETLGVLQETAPGALIDVARNLQEAQVLALAAKPDLFVLDLDVAPDLGPDFLYDLRTSHPNARAIILTSAHLPGQREQAAGLGAIHFLEKPFSRDDFAAVADALLRPAQTDTEKFHGTLSDLHIADIIQLKCMSGRSSVLEFSGPQGEKARVYFEKGHVRHATAPGKQGLAAFNEIVTWQGGTISELASSHDVPQTIHQDWQLLLMEAVRQSDEKSATQTGTGFRPKPLLSHKVLVIDDSVMLLRFVEEILSEARYEVVTAVTGEEGLRASKENLPGVILLDYVLPDMKGDEVSRKLLEDPATAQIPVVYMSGFGADLRPDQVANANVIAFLNKPFTSDLLIKSVENHMPKPTGEPEPTQPERVPEVTESLDQAQEPPVFQEQPPAEAPQAAPPSDEWWSPPSAVADSGATEWPEAPAAAPSPAGRGDVDFPNEPITGEAFFCGDTHFFSLHWALQTIARENLTGSLRAFWENAPVELLARNGQILLSTTRDPELYCPEAPVTLVNVDAERVAAARAQQIENGCPLFLTLAREGLILRDPAVQLVQHYGQKLFARLWTAQRVRFMFEQSAELPDFAREVSPETDVDHWALGCLRFIQFEELGAIANYDQASIPAYTKDGFERVQNLKLTVAEAQFASQFNGVRSIAQIAKNLRLDLKFARLTLFRFLALEIVECWPANTAPKPESKGIFQRFTRSIGVGE